MAELRKLTATKGQCKASLTRLERFIADEHSATVEYLTVRKNGLESTYAKYLDVCVQLAALSDKCAEDEEDDTEERYYTLMASLEHAISLLRIQNTQQTAEGGGRMSNLPSLDVPVFDGRDIAYKPFIEMFEAVVHRDSRLPLVQKLCFLKKYLKGEPLQLIDNLPIIAASYNAALELLKNRYDNPALLINSHVNSLLDIPALHRGTALQLRDLVAKVRQQLTALKNLKQPVETWDAILSCILLRKLDSFTVRLYHTERDNSEAHNVSNLLSFLEKRAAVLEASPTGGDISQNRGKLTAHAVTAIPSAIPDKSDKCIVCMQVHRVYKCPKFNSMSPNGRLDIVIKHSLCKICLGNHTKKCRYTFKCSVCGSKAHNTLIHVVDGSNSIGTEESSQSHCDKVNLHACLNKNNVLLPTAKVLVSDVHNNKHIVRALLDCGSQTSFCTADLATKLRLPQFNSAKNICTLGNESSKVSKGINLTVHSRVQEYKFDVSCSIIPKITTSLPQQAISLDKFTLPTTLALADDEFYVPGEVSLLLSADIFFRIVQDGKVEASPEDPVLLNTRLGYVVSGSISVSPLCNFNAVTMHTMVNPDLDSCVKQFWEAEKVPEVYLETVPEHEYSEQVFQETTSLVEDRFEVKFPLKIDFQDIDPSNSFTIALQRLYNLERRFAKDPEFHNLYKQFIQEYLDLGHAKIIDLKGCDPTEQPIFFLAHQAVLRPDKITNKLRTVFDGSARTKAGHSLNDVLCNGPVVQNTLFDIMMLFRTYKYTVQCDIRHMYRMIAMHPEHRRLQNILWREDGKLQCLQLQTVTYGLKSSAFLATRCLIELAKRHKSQYPLASEAIIKNSYVDDVQGGSDTLEGAVQLKNELISLMRLGGFDLHKWISNDPQTLQGIPNEKIGIANRDIDQDKSIVKILGLSYDAREDSFKMSGRVLTSPEVPTKRNVLSSISRLYDPMGFAGPLTVKAKLILQQIWQYDLEWDTPLPSELVKIWQTFYDNLINMPSIVIQRHLNLTHATDVQLVGYCDASAVAYGCCIYVKAVVNGKPYIHLLCSKSRVAPLASKLTIPKLELNGSLLLAKLVHHVALLLKISDIYLFCDSQIVLSWLDSPTLKLPAYIGNRVKEINRLTQYMAWKYTPGLLNPADILSRGADPQDIINNKLWHHGPDYLSDSNEYNFHLSVIKPALCAGVDCYETTEHIVNLSSTVNDKVIDPFFERFSSIFKMIRVTVHILRFIKKCKGNTVSSKLISVSECREALTLIIKGVQRHYFNSELMCIEKGKAIASNLKSLNPFVDSAGVLRVGGRLGNATHLDFSKKHNVILPKHCHVTKLIIAQEHLMLMHAGLKLVLGSLCQKYCIINSVREVKSVINKCLTCCKLKATASEQLMGSLPKERITPARVFEHTGLDYCGPFEIKLSALRSTVIGKGYVAVFVCFASKAVHLEVVTDMTTDAFIAALKRFIGRRGYPQSIHCDNASTFHGAKNKLKELHDLHKKESFKEGVNDYMLQRGIQFHFIPKYSPNHGGLWEAAVKSAKYHFKRIASNRIFTYEQFNTIIIEIEAILNSRPLTPLSHDTTDFSYLTPSHFLVGSELTSVPQPDLTNVPSNRLRFWRCCEQIRQHFWKVWSKEYLSLLNHRTKWQKEVPNLKTGMVVLLQVPNTAPLTWPLGRISKLFYGNDGNVRVVEVQTSDKKLHSRAISKIVVLPVEI